MITLLLHVLRLLPFLCGGQRQFALENLACGSMSVRVIARKVSLYAIIRPSGSYMLPSKPDGTTISSGRNARSAGTTTR